MDGLDALKLLFNDKVKEKETGAVTITIVGIWGLFDILEGRYNCLLCNGDDSDFRLSRDGKCALCKLISMFVTKKLARTFSIMLLTKSLIRRRFFLVIVLQYPQNIYTTSPMTTGKNVTFFFTRAM